MGVFPFTKKSKEPATGDASDRHRVDARVLVYATSLGWCSCVQQLDGSLTDHQSGVTLLVDGGEQAVVTTALQDAVTANLPTIQLTKKIFLLLDELSIQVTGRMWVDGRPGSDDAWQYGRQWLHTDDCFMAYAELPPVAGGAETEQRPSIHAFVNARQLADCLAPVMQLGVHVTGIVPQELLLVHSAARSGEPVYGGLQIGSHASTLVLVNQPLGILRVHKIPVGLSTLVKAAACKVGISEQDASQALGRRDLLAEVLPIAPDDLDGVLLLQGRDARFYGLRTALTRLLEDLKEYLAFFAAQDGSSLPSRLELFGASKQVTGLTEWLSRHLGLPAVPYHQPLLELFAQMETSASSQFFSPAQHVRNPRQRTQTVLAHMTQAQRMQDRNLFIWLGLLVVLACYWGYAEYQEEFKSYQKYANDYLVSVEEREHLRKKLSAEAAYAASTNATDFTKFIMAEKLLSLADNMIKNVWLTDIYFVDQEKNGLTSKNARILVIEGNVLPNTDGHLQIIAEYMDSLFRDEKWFMSDFRNVTLKSVKEKNAAQPDGVPYVHFVLHALYDKSKRQEVGVATKKMINQHDQELGDLLNGKSGE